jgi:alkylmercury lyase-like protein
MTANGDTQAFDREVRRQVYDHTMSRLKPPLVVEIARAMGASEAQIRAAFQRLADAHILVLQNESGEILMANPFSAVPTPFLVHTERGDAWGNCIWDALGIPAMLDTDARIVTGCGDCNESMALEIKGQQLASGEGIVHFSMPAKRWWDNIKFT